MGDWYMSRQLTSGVLGRRKEWLYKGEVWEYEEVTNPTTGRTWMDRNLGASRVAQSSNDALAYGDYFQWGRLDDLHQNSDSLETSVLSNSDIPDNDGKFITTNTSPFDWRNPSNDNLWQPHDLINIPAPKGWRVPTQAEMEAEVATWASENETGAFSSVLKLPVNGYRDHIGGSIKASGSRIYIWISPFTYFRIQSGFIAYFQNTRRAFGLGVRLIKEV